MLAHDLLDSFFPFEPDRSFPSLIVLIRVLRFPDSPLISVDVKRRITMKYMKVIVNLTSMSIYAQHICCICILKLKSFIISSCFKGQQKIRSNRLYAKKNMLVFLYDK